MMGILDGPPPRWFTIAAHRPFLQDLAAGLWRALSPLGPQAALSDALVLLPNRRAVRGLTEAFVAHAGGGGVLLPQMRAIGDLDEGEPPFEPGDLTLDLPPAIGAERRRFELAGLVAAHADLLTPSALGAASALDFADAVGALLDSLQIEKVAWPADSLDLAPPDMAEHWAVSAKFLDAVLAAWGERLAELGVMDVSARRVAVTRRLIERWEAGPPAGVVVAAGSTGSTKATADLLATISRAPKGLVVLPGLDRSLADAAWAQIDDQHPQGALSRLLLRAGIERGEVRPWDPAAESEVAGRWRRRLINEALRPPEATADWLEVIDNLRREAVGGGDPIAEGLKGLTVIAARAEEETAAAAAALLREALETPGRTAALVTPDAGLARRVQARLTRWGVRPDSSVGESLAASPAGTLAGLLARAAADPLDAVLLLAIVKHPLARLDMTERGAASETLERWGLRVRRPRAWRDIEEWLTEANDQGRLSDAATAGAAELLSRLKDALAPLVANAGATAHERTLGLVAALERLATGPDGETDLWRGAAGEALSRLFSSLLHDSEALPPMSPSAFAELIDGLMARTPLRRGGASHPRLAILGVLEARLINPDLTILAGLEEGVWPSAAPGDPFLSRPMRTALGLPPPERRIGLAAHDFAQAAAAPEVVLLHTQTREGAPSVKSRWLWRLEALVKGAGLTLLERGEALDWARRLDAPLSDPPASLRSAPRPSPTPPVAVRPNKLSVTAIERWVRDPYSIYAQSVLRLRALERPGAEPDARARGTAIHAAFERFAREHPDGLPSDGERVFGAMLIDELRKAGMAEAQLVRERALADNTAAWAMGFEAARRAGAVIHVELRGEMTLGSGQRAFTLTARADRIEVRGETADILDFKTGATPSGKQVKAFLAPQLTLTAAILAAGGFLQIGACTPGQLLYVRVRGGRIAGQELPVDGGDAPALAADALDRLQKMIEIYSRESQPYLSWTAPQFIGKYGADYDQLARLWEWAVVGEADGEATP